MISEEGAEHTQVQYWRKWRKKKKKKKSMNAGYGISSTSYKAVISNKINKYSR
jgi:hypothetical protein